MLLCIWGLPRIKMRTLLFCDSGLFNGTFSQLIKTEHFITLRSYRAVLNLTRNPSFHLLHISCSSFRVPLSTIPVLLLGTTYIATTIVQHFCHWSKIMRGMSCLLNKLTPHGNERFPWQETINMLAPWLPGNLNGCNLKASLWEAAGDLSWKLGGSCWNGGLVQFWHTLKCFSLENSIISNLIHKFIVMIFF